MQNRVENQFILVLDFGAQYSQLIARRVRELHVFSELQPFSYPLEEISRRRPKGIILSGGPSSVYAGHAPLIDKAIFYLGIPVLGICYGMQLMTNLLGGNVLAAPEREYGRTQLRLTGSSDLFSGFPQEPTTVWMSHGDRIEDLPPGFRVIAKSDNSPFAAMAHRDLPLYGVQFHPEVSHTEFGETVLENFVYKIASATPNWVMANFIEESVAAISNKVGSDHVICGLSGGVDSSVVAALTHRAIGDQLTCVFVDNGLLRRGEVDQVKRLFGDALHVDLRVIDATEQFLEDLRGIADPEEKRKRIGYRFIQVFEEVAKEIEGVKYLAQGTLYPDVIESISWKGPDRKSVV